MLDIAGPGLGIFEQLLSEQPWDSYVRELFDVAPADELLPRSRSGGPSAEVVHRVWTGFREDFGRAARLAGRGVSLTGELRKAVARAVDLDSARKVGWSREAAEFAAGYAARSGVTVEWLVESRRMPLPCECGAEDCEGWMMVPVTAGQQDGPVVASAVVRRDADGLWVSATIEDVDPGAQLGDDAVSAIRGWSAAWLASVGAGLPGAMQFTPPGHTDSVGGGGQDEPADGFQISDPEVEENRLADLLAAQDPDDDDEFDAEAYEQAEADDMNELAAADAAEEVPDDAE